MLATTLKTLHLASLPACAEGCQGGAQAAEALLQRAVVRVKCGQAHHLYVVAGSFRDAGGDACLGLTVSVVSPRSSPLSAAAAKLFARRTM